MSTTTNGATAEQADERQTYEYAVIGLHGTYATRHEAVGKQVLFGCGDVVPIATQCVTRPHRYPEHLGNKHYADRKFFATRHGAVRVHHEALIRHRNGEAQGTVESHWEADCPVCLRTHRTDAGLEKNRSELFDLVVECCGTEWFPPADWVEDCGVCGEDHRERHGCTPPGRRHPIPGVDEDYECTSCGWEGDGETLQGPNGTCPACDSAAVRVVA